MDAAQCQMCLSHYLCEKKDKITLSICSKLTNTGFVYLIRNKKVLHINVYCYYQYKLCYSLKGECISMGRIG